MPERVARLGSMHYKDSDGRYRTASAGDTIQVHPDYLERFDRLNVLLGEKPEDVKAGPEAEPVTPEPAEVKPRRGRPPKKADDE
jgi:hypothetical protein